MPGSRYGHHGRRTAGHRSRHSGRLWPPLHESRDAGSRRRLATGPGRPPLHAARLRREPALRTRSCRAPLAQRRVPARRHRAAGGRASRRGSAVARARPSQRHAALWARRSGRLAICTCAHSCLPGRIPCWRDSPPSTRGGCAQAAAARQAPPGLRHASGCRL